MVIVSMYLLGFGRHSYPLGRGVTEAPRRQRMTLKQLLEKLAANPAVIEDLNADTIVGILDEMERLHCKLLERLIDLQGANSFFFAYEEGTGDNYIFNY